PTWKERIKRSLVIAVGMAIPGISIAALMAWEGSFQQLAYWTIEASRYYIGVVPISVAMELFSRTFTQLFLENPVPWLLGGVGAVLLPFGRTARWRRWGIGLFAAFAFMAIIPGFRFFGHYFLLTFPAVALFGAHASYVISSRSIPFIGKADQGLALRTLVLLSVPILAGHWNYYFRPDHVGVLRTVYRTNPFPEARYVADMINAERQEDDGVFVMGSEPQIYVYTGTRSPTRFINMGYLVHEHPMADSLRREAMSDVAKAAPKYVVWVQHLGSWMPGPNADQSFLERYWNTLHEEYDIVAWFEQDPPMQVRIISGEAAKDHRPASELFMFLARRKDIRDAGATVLNGAPPERN
ncbi:MAG: hypothetical protein KDC00_07880, partial [Flavobacteriales bacterium]|nr:hypothetical protein [Flavobacteriales bacterium]